MATYEGIIATLTRITEAGDVRITEDGNARILTNEGESVVVSDIVTVVLTTQGIVAESVGVSDTVEVRATRNVSIEESASASDEVGVQWVAHGDVEESVDVADAVEVSWQAHVEIEESVSASDETVTNWQAHVEIEESATIDDSAVGVEQNYAYSPSSVAVSDTVEVVATHPYSLMTIEGNETFAVGDILRINDGVRDEWLEVVTTADAPTYGVNRDKAGNYADGSNPEWKKGASVVNYGQAGDGAVYMTASEAHAPYLSIFTHEGEPWSAITTHIREGNLNGYAGYTSDTFGWASYIDDNNFIKIDPVNGIRMSGEVTITGGNTTLDVIANGVTYGRVQTAVLDSGYLYLMRRNEDATEQLLVTASGIEGYANSVKNFELASGIAYLGDQSNEHVKISSSGFRLRTGLLYTLLMGLQLQSGKPEQVNPMFIFMLDLSVLGIMLLMLSL